MRERNTSLPLPPVSLLCVHFFNWINPNRQPLKAKEAAAKVGGIRKIFVFGPQEEGAISFSSLLEADGPVCTSPLLFKSL